MFASFQEGPGDDGVEGPDRSHEHPQRPQSKANPHSSFKDWRPWAEAEMDKTHQEAGAPSGKVGKEESGGAGHHRSPVTRPSASSTTGGTRLGDTPGFSAAAAALERAEEEAAAAKWREEQRRQAEEKESEEKRKREENIARMKAQAQAKLEEIERKKKELERINLEQEMIRKKQKAEENARIERERKESEAAARQAAVEASARQAAEERKRRNEEGKAKLEQQRKEQEAQRQREAAERTRRAAEEARRRHEEADMRRRKDAGRAAGSLTDTRALWVEHERAWEAFESNPPSFVGYAHVPWPPTTDGMIQGMASVGGPSTQNVNMKKVYRHATMRWHPDKFMSKFGARLIEAEKELIHDRVMDISQCLNRAWSLMGH